MKNHKIKKKHYNYKKDKQIISESKAPSPGELK